MKSHIITIDIVNSDNVIPVIGEILTLDEEGKYKGKIVKIHYGGDVIAALDLEINVETLLWIKQKLINQGAVTKNASKIRN